MTERRALDGLEAWRRDLPRTGPGPYAVRKGRVLSDGLEVIATHHCNLRCRACAYLSPVLPPTLVDPACLERDLAILARHYHVTEARVLGGEPLLHPQLLGILDVIRQSSVCDSVRVLTNGLMLPRMPTEFWDAVDAVSVSMYPNRCLDEDAVRGVRKTAESHGVQINFKPFHYFRESYSEVGTRDGELVARIYRTCQIANVWRCHTIWNGYLLRCPQSLFLPAAFRSDESHEAGEIDGFPLADRSTLAEDLLEFLESEEPPWSCTYCLGSVGRLFEHTQTPRTHWRADQGFPTEDLVDSAQLAFLEDNPGVMVPDASYIAGSEASQGTD